MFSLKRVEKMTYENFQEMIDSINPELHQKIVNTIGLEGTMEFYENPSTLQLIELEISRRLGISEDI